MPYAERIRMVDERARGDLIRYVGHVRHFLAPANPDEIAAIIFGVFEAFDVPSPSQTSLRFWFDALGQYPLFALKKAARELILESSFAPKIADLVKRAQLHVSGVQGLMMQAQMLLDYGTAPPDETPVNDEQRAKVREIMAAAGLGHMLRVMNTDPEDGR